MRAAETSDDSEDSQGLPVGKLIAAAVATCGLATVLVAGIGIAIPSMMISSVIGSANTGQTGSSQPPAGGALKPTTVPGNYVQWIIMSGSICREITPALIAAQIYTESTFQDHPTNSVGAAGPGQFTAATWKQWGIDADNDGDKDLHSIPDAVVATGRMDCGMIKMLGTKIPDGADKVGLALAAYHDGPAAVIAANGIPDNALTRWYVSTIESLAINKFSEPAAGLGGGAAGPLASKAIQEAKAELGIPYSLGGGTPQGPSVGGTSPAGWDCSSFVQMAYYRASNGRIVLPRTTYEQIDSSLVAPVPMTNLKPGDLIFVQTGGDGWGHVVMYAGNNKIIEEPHTGGVSRIMTLSEYNGMTMTARRVKG